MALISAAACMGSPKHVACRAAGGVRGTCVPGKRQGGNLTGSLLEPPSHAARCRAPGRLELLQLREELGAFGDRAGRVFLGPRDLALRVDDESRAFVHPA